MTAIAAGLREGCCVERKKDRVLVLGGGRQKHICLPLLPWEGSLLKRGWGWRLALKLNLWDSRDPRGTIPRAVHNGALTLRAPGRWGWDWRPRDTAGQRRRGVWGRCDPPGSRRPLRAGRETTRAARPRAEARALRGSRWRCAPRCWTGSRGSTPQRSSQAWLLCGEG